MFANHQYQYQQAGSSAVSTGGMVWNGTAWVASTVAAGHGGRSSYSTNSFQGANAAAAVETPAAKVAKFTQYYHQWTARAKEHEQHAQRLPLNSNERTEAQRNVDWAKFYADQSSRAAHHFHSNPYTEPPFELPPAPQASTGQQQHAQTQQQQRQPKQPQESRWSSSSRPTSAAKPSSESSSSGAPPDSLKRYVHRCMQQCTTEEQKKQVQKETERVIAEAIQNSTLHSKNWDTVPLIAVPARKRDSPPSTYNQHGQNQNISSKKQKVKSNSIDMYYGPSGHGGGSAATASGGYYGPSSSPHPNPTASSPTSQQQQQQSFYQKQSPSNSKYQSQNHYGPSGGGIDGEQDFIALPNFGGKNKGLSKNKYVNPNSAKKKKALGDDGFQRSSTTLAQRANRFSGPGGNADVRQATAKGIDARYMGKGVIGGSTKKLDETDYEQMKVKGTCTKLEKQYLRLTAPPKAELVRPLEILQQHLKNLKAEWKLKNRRDYLWFCSEMKAVRQDLTVQHIQTSFTVDAYEFHARIALQEGDMNEFNQAQTQLKILYDKLDDAKSLENENEFVAYRMIYFVIMSLTKNYSGGSSDLLKLMLSLTPSQRSDPAIKHSLQLRAAVAEMDYHKFFQLRTSCPNLGDKLISRSVPTMRHWALQRIARAYRPSVSVEFALKELGFPIDTAKEIDDGKKYLLSCGCVFTDDGLEIKGKESAIRESDLEEKRSLN